MLYEVITIKTIWVVLTGRHFEHQAPSFLSCKCNVNWQLLFNDIQILIRNNDESFKNNL